MVKINLDNRGFIVLIAALFSGLLAFVILRQLLLNPGIIEAIDIQWNQNFAMFEYFFHTWNFYTDGSNIIFASQFPVYGWVLVFRNVELAQRFVYFLTVSLVSFNMFLVAYYTLKKTIQKTFAIYLGSIVASLIYTLNPLMISEIFHISFLWAYSLFPLVFYFGWESFNTSSRRKVLVSALLLSMFFAFMADAWGMLIGLLILVIIAISSAVMNGRKNLLHLFAPNFLLTLLIMGIATVLIAAFWLLPYITQRASGPVWDPFSLANLVSNSLYSGLANIFGLHSWSAQPFYPSTLVSQNQLLDWSFFGVWQSLTLIIPIIAVLAVLIRRNKFTLTLSGLLLIGVFLATGVKYSLPNLWPPPIGEFYKWLTFYSPRIIPNQTFLLKYPYLFLAIASLAVALLSAFLVAEVFRRVNFNFKLKRFSAKSHALPTVLFFSIISLIALVGAPLLTGNLNGALAPVTLPDQYKELNAFFSNQNGSFRVMYVPQEANFNWSANPWANKIEYWGSGATPLMYGWGISASPNTGFLGDLAYDYLSTNQTQYLGKLLALCNVRFIVFHNDSKYGDDQASAYPAINKYFTEYTKYLNNFLSPGSDNQSGLDHYLGDYLNFTTFVHYNEDYKNSSIYQTFLTSSNQKLKEYITNTPDVNSLINKINSDNSSAYESYLQGYNKTYENAKTYLSKYLNSAEYHNYTLTYQIGDFMDSQFYNDTHNYLNSSEFLIYTGSQYFRNSSEYLDFMNSVEYRDFLYYYLVYSQNYRDFQRSMEYTNYETYLNYNSITEALFSNIQSQRDLKLVPFSRDNLFVFENTEIMNYFQAYSKVNLVVGGLDTIGSLSSIDDFYLNASEFLFVQNQHFSESNLGYLLNSKDLDKTLTFYDNKTFNDLVLDTFDANSYIAPGEVFIETNAVGWLKDASTSYSWTPLTLGSYTGQKYDFGLGNNLLYTTTPGAYFDIPARVDKSGTYSIWLRVLFSPGGGNLRLSIINNAQIDEQFNINTNNRALTGFKWVNLANNVPLNVGSRFNFTSEIGLNAINLIALPTINELDEHKQNLTDIINQSNAKIVYFMDKPFLNSYPNHGANFSIYVPQESPYIINFEGNPQSITIDGKTVIVTNVNSFSKDQNWNSTGPISLSSGYHLIDFNSTFVDKTIIYSSNNSSNSSESLNDIFDSGAEPYVVTYKKTDSVSFSVDVNASKGFILGFQEPYDESWQSNISSTKLFLNSVNNGFFVDSNGALKTVIHITYSPEQSLQLGLKITLVSFLASLTILCVVLLYPKIRQKRTVQRRFGS